MAISVSRDEPGYATEYAPGYESVLWNTHEVYYPQDVKGNIQLLRKDLFKVIFPDFWRFPWANELPNFFIDSFQQ